MLMARHQRIAKLFDEEFGVTRWRSLEKQECDRQMSGSGWPLSVAFWFGLIGAGCGQGTYIVNGRKVRKRWLLACPWKFAWMKMPLWSLFVWGNCHVPRNISEWEKRRAGFLAGSPALSLFLGLPSAHGAVPVSPLRPGGLIAHGGQGLLPCWGKVRCHCERGRTLVMVCHCPLWLFLQNGYNWGKSVLGHQKRGYKRRKIVL